MERMAATHTIKTAGLTGSVYTAKGSPKYQLYFRHPQSRERQRISLGTENLEMALAKAKAILQKTGADGIAALKGYARRTGGRTVGEAVDHYLKVSTVATKQDNVNSLLRVLRTATGAADSDKARALPLARLSAKLVADYLRKATVAKTTQKSSLASARAVFCRFTDWQGFAGLPDLSEFRNAATRTGIRTGTNSFQPLPKDVLAKMEEATKRLGGAHRRAYILARYLGLGPKEIAGCRRGWIEERGGKHLLCVRQRPDENFTLKTGAVRERDLGIPETMVSELLTADDYMVPGGTPYMRLNWCLRHFNGWLREFIPDRRSALYELRRQAGSDWLTATGKISLVARMLGHASPTTSARFYATYERQVDLPEGLWAK